jgi:hypothetical protein
METDAALNPIGGDVVAGDVEFSRVVCAGGEVVVSESMKLLARLGHTKQMRVSGAREAGPCPAAE